MYVNLQVVNIKEKIEQLKEALRKPDERRRSLSVIEAEKSMPKKEQIHARVSGQL
jgi:hypothetical protein